MSPSRYPPLWLQAIEEATVCLRRNGRDNANASNSSHNQTRRTARGTEYVVPVVAAAATNSPSIQQEPCFFSCASSCASFPEVLDASHQYLVLLENHLRRREATWDLPPKKKPPKRLLFELTTTTSTHDAVETRQSSEARQQQQYAPENPSSNNRFAAFEDYDDEEENENTTDSDDDDEAGDEPLLNVVCPPRQHEAAPLAAQDDMSMRRLLIRVLTNQSEIFAAMASQLRRSQQWTLGAEKLTCSLNCIHQALILADSEISRWLYDAASTSITGTQDYAAADWQTKKSGLYQDADIVQVSIESLTVGRDAYLKEAKRVESSLIHKLAPQWESRDEIKERMGDRWYSNPAPKRDYARLREEAEAQLRDVQGALQHLEAIQTGELHDSTERLRDRLYTSETGATSGSSSSQQHRYNGRRPRDISRRVNIEDYPDPTTFGWRFTGSNEYSAVEFFENEDDGIKLDWYYTTATVKTSMDHPSQGRTQLFGSKVDPATYRRILQNPRHHTGQRYHRRRQQQYRKEQQQQR